MNIWLLSAIGAGLYYWFSQKKSAKGHVQGKSGIVWDVEGAEVSPMPGAALITNATVSYKGTKIITYSQVGTDVSQRLLTWANPAAEAQYFVTTAKTDFGIAAPLITGPTAGSVMNPITR